MDGCSRYLLSNLMDISHMQITVMTSECIDLAFTPISGARWYHLTAIYDSGGGVTHQRTFLYT